MTTPSPMVTPTRSHFNRRVDEIRASKTDLNKVVMDYLVNNGFPNAAQHFAREANIDPQSSIEAINARVAIRDAILSGQIEDAIERVNDLNPEILDTDPQLHFSLLRLHLIEITRRGDPNSKDDLVKAITFANKQLAPRVKGNQLFIEGLESAMALLIFPRDKLPATLKPLLDPSLRLEIASQVNSAILISQGCRREAAIHKLIKARTWAEQKCHETKKPIPTRLNLGLKAGEDDEAMQGDDGDPMVT